MPVAGDPERPAAAQHAVRLSRLVELGRHAGSHPSRTLCGVPGARRTGSQPHRRHHRQPKREKRGKRGACIDPHGYDAGKKIKGKKRHILVDTVGLLLHAIVHPADIQDRDGGVLVMATLFGMFPFLKTLFADSGYQGPKFAKALAKVLPHLDIEIVKRSDQIRSADLWSCPNAGSSSAPLPGSIAVEGLPRIGRISTEKRSRSCASPQSASCSENSAIRPEVSGRTLRGASRNDKGEGKQKAYRRWRRQALYLDLGVQQVERP